MSRITNDTGLQTKHLFSNIDLRKLLIPLIIEQLLNSLMGTIDTVMVSNVGSEAISAVSLVDSINILIIQLFTALAAGGVIICSHYIGSGNDSKAGEAAKQVLLVSAVISAAITCISLILKNPLLSLVFGNVEAGVMKASRTYFFYTALSFPFIAVYNAGASVFRAQENTKTPMTISVISNIVNVAGNAILIWGFHMGVAGAAISTLTSRVFCGVAVMIRLRNKSNRIYIREYGKIRPDFSVIKRVLLIGIPSGVESSMFQFGKLAIQSTVSTMGTTAIAAQAMTNILENLNGIGGIGIGIGLMTVVSECMGAGRKDEAVYYIKKLTLLGEIAVVSSCILVFALTKPVTWIAGMEAESARLCFRMICVITIVKPIIWTLSFVPAYGLRAAGDVRFSMILSCCTMWLCRVSLCIFLARVFGMGPMAVWIGMFADWTIRGIGFSVRFKSGRWAEHKVI